MRTTTIIATTLGLAACASPGSVAVSIWGEEFIEQKIPAADVEDGWEISFSKFLVVVGELEVASSDGDVGAEFAKAKVFDVHQPGPTEVVRLENVLDRDWDAVSYAIAPSTSPEAGNASAEDVERMKANGWSVYLEGTATKGAVTKTLKWGFTTNTLYEQCGPHEGDKGLTVPSGGEAKVQLTIHADHLFYDDLQDPDAKMRFDAMATADKNDDGEVTLAELAAVPLSSLPLGTYGTGSVANVDDLQAFVTTLLRTIGHFQGEGECSPRAR